MRYDGAPARRTARARVVFRTLNAVLTFHVQVRVYGGHNAGAVPSVGFELPRALVLKNSPHVVHDEHGFWHQHAHLSLPLAQPRSVVAD